MTGTNFCYLWRIKKECVEYLDNKQEFIMDFSGYKLDLLETESWGTNDPKT